MQCTACASSHEVRLVCKTMALGLFAVLMLAGKREVTNFDRKGIFNFSLLNQLNKIKNEIITITIK
jgi:hypothetical protein